MALLIDTYNLLHAAIPIGGPFTDLTVHRLCQYLCSSPVRQKTTLVLDGRAKPSEPSENEFPELHLVYSGAGVSADTVIAQLLERSHDRRHLTVVSNDREVASHARRHRAHAQSCEAFLQSLMTAHSAGRKLGQARLPTHKTEGLADPAITDRWLQEFGIDPATAPVKKRHPGNSPEDMTDDDIEKLMRG